MNLSHEEEDNSLSLSKFESMLKTNKVFFFDSEEFEDIILHYLDTGKINLLKVTKCNGKKEFILICFEQFN